MNPLSHLVPLLVVLLFAGTSLRSSAAYETAPRPGHQEPSPDPLYRAEALRQLDVSRNKLLQAERSGVPRAEHAALKEQAQAEFRVGLYVEFLGTTMRALQLAQGMGDVQALADGLRDLSLAYQLNHQPDKAVEEARNALAMVLPSRDHEAIARGQRFLLGRMIDAGRSEEAMLLGENALERARAASDAMGVARVHHLLAGLRVDRGAYGEALAHLTIAEDFISERGAMRERQRLALDMARANIGLRRSSKAAHWIAEAGILLAVEEDPEHQTLLDQARYELAVSERRWEQAVSLLARSKERTDSLARAQVALQMAGLQVRYQLGRKEADNAMLRDLNSQQTVTIAVQEADHRVLLALLAFMAALVIGLVFTVRHSMRVTRRLRNRNGMIRRQSDEIQATNLQLERQNRRLAEALLSDEEKETTIKEIHHRVKNNLQVVDSLLGIQRGGQSDPAVERLFKEAQGRIRSMALVHEHIYHSGGITEGTLRNHLAQLARSVLSAYGMHDRISVTVDSNEPMLPVDTLMPLTLLVNELITNAVKHAFAGRDQGQIRIIVRKVGEEHELLFADDGVGLSDQRYLRNGSFGLEMVQVLAQQLGGEVQVVHGAGATFKLRFKQERPAVRLAS